MGVMPKIKTVEMTTDQKAALEKEAKYGATPSFRLRCQAILLKADQRTSLDVAQQLGCCEMSVNDWMKRFAQQGLDGLKVAKGRGRKALLQTEQDLEVVRRAVQKHRQQISLAKAELEQELGKEFSTLTLKRFLKKTVAASSAFDDA